MKKLGFLFSFYKKISIHLQKRIKEFCCLNKNVNFVYSNQTKTINHTTKLQLYTELAAHIHNDCRFGEGIETFAHPLMKNFSNSSSFYEGNVHNRNLK